MAGYNGYSKSNNAVSAERSGRYPLIKATAVLRAKLKKEGVSLTKKQCKELLLSKGTDEWHHSSKFYNIVDYYDVFDCVDFLFDRGIWDPTPLPDNGGLVYEQQTNFFKKIKQNARTLFSPNFQGMREELQLKGWLEFAERNNF